MEYLTSGKDTLILKFKASNLFVTSQTPSETFWPFVVLIISMVSIVAEKFHVRFC